MTVVICARIDFCLVVWCGRLWCVDKRGGKKTSKNEWLVVEKPVATKSHLSVAGLAAPCGVWCDG